MFDLNDIQQLCMRDITFLKAQQLYVSGGVKNLREEEAEVPEAVYIEAEVDSSGKEPYYVWLRYNKETDELENYECECAAFANYEGMCKHCAALGLEYLAHQKSMARLDSYRTFLQSARKAGRSTDERMRGVIKEYAMRRRMQNQEAHGMIELEPELYETGRNYYYGRTSYTVTFKIGPADGRKYVLKSLTDFINAVQNEDYYSYGKKLAFVHRKSMFTPDGWRYVELIEAGLNMRSSKGEPIGKELQLNQVTMEQFLNLNLGREVSYHGSGYCYESLQILDENPPIELRLQETEGGYRLEIPALTLWRGSEHLFVRMKQQVYRCSGEYRYAMEKLLECADEDKVSVCRIAEEDMMSFCSVVLPELEQHRAVNTGELALEQYRPQQAQISYYLDEENGKITLKAVSSYGEQNFILTGQSPERESQIRGDSFEAILFGEIEKKRETVSEAFRDRMKEQQALELAQAYFPYEDSGEEKIYFESGDSDRMYHLLDTGIRQLEETGTVYATDRIQAHSLIRYPKAQVGVSLQSGLLELSVSSDAFDRAELSGILESYRKKKKYHRLKNGDFINLEQNAATAMAELLDGLGLTAKQLSQEQIELPKYRACYIDQSVRQSDGQIRMDRDDAYRAVIREMKSVEDSEYRIPEGLNAELREYQKTGYRWLRTLAHLGFGGILADDMGLGKTLQTIAYLLARKEEGVAEGPSLIICPASLVYNWQKELERFAPQLKVQMLAGGAAEREEHIKEGKRLSEGCFGQEAADVWITSYDMVKRDVELYDGLRFDTEIIDEAQNIKNQGTQAAKAVKKINAGIRFALTGTPIENRLSELWSIFDYLMPGLLGTYEKFRKKYELPIVQEQDEEVTARLQRMAAPFILRRLKQKVLKELPDKLEQIVYAKMETDQRKLYLAHVEELRESLEGKSGEEISKDKLQILAELTRLRQICCDPALIYENYKGSACKEDTCIELVKEAVSGNHKVLIFSQFTSIFEILGRRLEKEGIAYYELTGKTPKEERQRLMEAFNTDEVPVFLISLKAGGTGLNLTAASIVIHFDPWWNLAAQNQATDRAHRIGQRSQVTVFKLIAQDTIEENIVDLQEQKQEMAGKILTGGGLSTAMLTKEDFMEILKF